MAMTTLACPHCGFSKSVDEFLLPPIGKKVTCPRCSGSFQFRGMEEPAPVAAAGLAFDPGNEPPSPPPPPVKEEQRSSSSVPPAPPRYVSRTLTFTFTGNAREYFGIWIVNTLLQIVTLGIYSPWAKVRKRRYFYGNTLLDDAPFDYLADPLAILKGWFIAAAFFGMYSLATKVNPIAASVLMFAGFAIYPWVIVRSRIFNLRNSTHRNIRFGFTPNYREAYKVFLWWQLLVPLTLGLLTPYVIYRQKRFLVENSSYGAMPFRFHAEAREYYKPFFEFLLYLVLCILVLGGSIFAVMKVLVIDPRTVPLLVSAVPLVLLSIIYFIAGIYIPTILSNITWNATSLGEHRFESRLEVLPLAWIYFSNIIAIACTLGLLAPWGAVRLARYRLGTLTLTGEGGVDSVVSGAHADVGAAGEELGDMLGFELGL